MLLKYMQDIRENVLAGVTSAKQHQMQSDAFSIGRAPRQSGIGNKVPCHILVEGEMPATASDYLGVQSLSTPHGRTRSRRRKSSRARAVRCRKESASWTPPWRLRPA